MFPAGDTHKELFLSHLKQDTLPLVKSVKSLSTSLHLLPQLPVVLVQPITMHGRIINMIIKAQKSYTSYSSDAYSA